jgi:uncharacterized ParB-like nuclease family protein
MTTHLQTTKFLTLGLGLFLLGSCASRKPASNQMMVATMEVKEPIEGVCDNDKVYALSIMSMMNPESATDATCSMTEDEMQKRLNEEVAFLRENPNFNGKGMVGMIINCKNEMVQCRISNKTESEVLDAQILAVFKTFLSRSLPHQVFCHFLLLNHEFS